MLLSGGLATFLLALFALGFCQSQKDLLNLKDGTDDVPPAIGIPLEFVIMKAEGDIALMFGFEMLQGIRDIRMDCDILRRQEEIQFSNEMNSIVRYYEEAKRVLSDPEFEEYFDESRTDVEGNFRDAFGAMDQKRNEKLQRIRAECDLRIDRFLDSKKSDAMSYADYLVQKDPAKFVTFLFDMSGYSTQLREGLLSCQKFEELSASKSFGDPYELCYGIEVNILVMFIQKFIAEASQLAEEYYGDDEDYNSFASGSGESTVPVVDLTEPTPTTQSTEMTISEIPVTRPSRPTILTSEQVPTTRPYPRPRPPLVDHTTSEPHTQDTNTVAPTRPESVTTPAEVPTTQPRTRPPTTSELHTQDTNTAAPTRPESVTTPAEVPTTRPHTRPPTTQPRTRPPTTQPRTRPPDDTTDDTTPTSSHATPPWLNSAFNTIEEESEGDETPEEPSDSDGIELDGGIEVNLPGGVEIDVDVEVGDDGVTVEGELTEDEDEEDVGITGHVEILYDDREDEGQEEGEIIIEPEPEPEPEEENSWNGYLTVYVLTIVIVLLLVAIIIVMIAIIVVRQRQRFSRDSPLLSEEEKILVMKQTGYVNPTYKFFDQVSDA